MTTVMVRGLWLAVSALGVLAGSAGLLARGHGELPGPSGPHRVAQQWRELMTSEGPLRVYLAYPELPRSAQMPLVLYAPSWGAGAAESPLLLADLASQGFFVCAFDDVARAAQAADESDSAFRARTAKLEWTDAAMRAAEQRVALEAARATRILDGLVAAVGRHEAPFAQLTLDRIGFVGYSFGGAVATEAALQDPRIAGAVNLDGLLFGPLARRALPRSYLVVSAAAAPALPRLRARTDSEQFLAGLCRRDEAQYARQTDGVCRVLWSLPEARHEDLSDALFEPGWLGRLRLSWTSRIALRHGLVARVTSALKQLSARGSDSCRG